MATVIGLLGGVGSGNNDEGKEQDQQQTELHAGKTSRKYYGVIV
jgi:hypothetical protein